MNMKELTLWLGEYLKLEDFRSADISLNGLQIGRRGEEIHKAAFAVDACLESLQRAADAGAQMLFVHHGLFWGSPIAVTGMHYQRISCAIEHDIALFAAHLPLDAHPESGNNAVMANMLGLNDIRPFGAYHGVDIGVTGELSESKSLFEIRDMLGFSEHAVLLPFGKKEEIRSVAIVSGGASSSAEEAADKGIDLFITGEILHQVYHSCLERGLSVIGGGHYDTETFGVQAMAELLSRKFGIQTQFIDIPTGL
jgi:dinuclear metal center YbgI/SA1388 family protein